MKVLIVVLFAVFGLSACQSTKPTYYYGEYQEALYNYFKSDGIAISEQISVMQNVIARAPNKGLLVAPGAHAHLGLLYFESGNPAQGMNHFDQEKMLFPESTTYINFLIKNLTGAGE